MFCKKKAVPKKIGMIVRDFYKNLSSEVRHLQKVKNR